MKSQKNQKELHFAEIRKSMVEEQLMWRGIRSTAVLNAMAVVPREKFIPESEWNYAYCDSPIPIECGQTISQPYIVAYMIECLELRKADRVLEVGSGSGYAASILGQIVSEVYGIEWHKQLAVEASSRVKELHYSNVHIFHGDGSQGLAEYAPYDAILVSAGGWQVPTYLRDQLAIGGRLIIPVGATPQSQSLKRVRRVSHDRFVEEDLGRVRFVPLVGSAGWSSQSEFLQSQRQRKGQRGIPGLLAEVSEHFIDIEQAQLEPLLERIADCRVVLIGEATHGTSEFYRMRARITRELISKKGFQIVAIEGDWPDARQIDRYVRHRPQLKSHCQPFSRFPLWMWRNIETAEFSQWLRAHNQSLLDPSLKVTFAGLDIYSLYCSIEAVLKLLEQKDPMLAEETKKRYECLSPWESDPASYGRAVLNGRYQACEQEVLAVLRDLLRTRMHEMEDNYEDLLDAIQNARVVVNAEEYYREMYYHSVSSWNLRDSHMFETLLMLLNHYGENSKAVVWAHNSHVGNAAVTDMAARGEFNIGQLCREKFKSKSFHIGFGCDHGQVAAASAWGARMQVMDVRPAMTGSYERLCHDSGVLAFLLHLRDPKREVLRDELMAARLERAIGVIYRPETERLSHYFQAVLPEQFDEYIWFDKGHAVSPLPEVTTHGLPDTYPFGL